MATILSISLPDELRKRLDAEAKRRQRSRSFVVAEAIRGYLAGREQDAFARGRERTLREGLAMSPAERVKLSEELWREFTWGRGPAVPWTAAFDTFEQYDAWRRGEGVASR